MQLSYLDPKARCLSFLKKFTNHKHLKLSYSIQNNVPSPNKKLTDFIPKF